MFCASCARVIIGRLAWRVIGARQRIEDGNTYICEAATMASTVAAARRGKWRGRGESAAEMRHGIFHADSSRGMHGARKSE